ncbi:CHRNA7-FAM7A fusion protein-like [Haliotis rufescens]|uniref:CHRNA7-FAM7A fusion protein-like n=1 Tax=Haliotis rufescens TaxID=6454 RepID=UPI001EAFC2F5|nr:CHRNA7-FAM7A fusion protein-like [Haliotis rufescens]
MVNLTLNRRPSYYVFNLMIPIMLLSTLSSLVFALPVEYGDKVAFSMTVLLSFSVFLTQMTDIMPRTSRQASYLTIYLTILLTLSSLTVVMSVIILNIYKRQGEVPLMLQKLVIRVKCPTNKKLDPDVGEGHDEDPSWQEVSAKLDAVFLRVFLFMNIILGVVLFTVVIEADRLFTSSSQS